MITCTMLLSPPVSLSLQYSQRYSLFLRLAIAMKPHFLHAWIRYWSETSHSLSFKNLEAPWVRLSLTVGDHAISFHLTKPQTSVSASTLGRLLVQILKFASCSGVNFVIDHVTKSLVVGWADEDLGFQLLTGEGIEHNLGLDRLTSLPCL